jgi:hypothetical protein
MSDSELVSHSRPSFSWQNSLVANIQDTAYGSTLLPEDEFNDTTVDAARTQLQKLGIILSGCVLRMQLLATRS